MKSDLEELFLASMERHSVPGVSMTLVEGGEVAWSEGLGAMSSETGEPVTPDTIFEAASISKPVFAYAALRMHERGVIEIDAPLDGYLSEPFLEGDPRLSMITMRRVLCHTTGFQNWRREKPLEIHFDPGERFSYSGEGYVYLQRVLEELSGLPLERLMEDAILDPFGMADSCYVWRDDFEGRTASPHDGDGKVQEIRHRSMAMSASSLYSTSGDLDNFIAEIVEPSSMDESHLSRNIVEEMLRPQVAVNDSISWGLGWGLQHGVDGDSFWQWGDNGGYKNFAVASREGGWGAVVLTNGANGLRVCEEVIPEAVGAGMPAFSEFLSGAREKGYIL
ncbi:MAG: beta-lactamase family protein [Candidatus Bathyarchaeota archaeon]|nr:MAG: beta-lactamase family protein [Candidatus Bathyarchaeota archaeon]